MPRSHVGRPDPVTFGELDWYDNAACRAATNAGDADTADWYPSRGDWDTPAVRQALAICSTCPVRDDCLDLALTQPAHDDVGIWGGLSERARRRLRRDRARARQRVAA
jgi:WhiB family redox-sensing transcriptional regulator